MSEESATLLLPSPAETGSSAKPTPRTRRPRQRKPAASAAAPEIITQVSQQPAALEVANARKGSSEDSTSARLPASYPYRTRMRRQDYEKAKHDLQIELLKVQNWVKETGQRIVVLFEGRDAAGKGGTIKRFMEHLNPRGARIVALENRQSRKRASGTSSVMCNTFPPPVKWCSSIAPGTTAPGSRR